MRGIAGEREIDRVQVSTTRFRTMNSFPWQKTNFYVLFYLKRLNEFPIVFLIRKLHILFTPKMYAIVCEDVDRSISVFHIDNAPKLCSSRGTTTKSKSMIFIRFRISNESIRNESTCVAAQSIQ